MIRGCIALVACLVLTAAVARAQETTGTIEGAVTDRTAGVVAGAQVTAINLDTGLTKAVTSGRDGFYRMLLLPVGRYTIAVDAPQFATLVRQAIQVNLGQVVRVNALLELPTLAETVTVTGSAQLVDTTTNALGRVVTGRELVDLPLNGRNFTQLGLLQTGVAPLTNGVATAGGSLRQGQAYAVNGMRPESNMYLVDGGQNLNRMDGGYALKLPVEAIAEFRILTQSAPPEYGGTGGATTSVITRSGSNQLHGNIYEFVRNDVFDARNYFSEKVEPLKQNQFGGTISGPIARNRLLFFGYYEGLRNRQGYTTTATVPSDLQRSGNFSDLGTPLINFAAGGVPFPGNQIPAAAINPVSLNVLGMYPRANVGSSLYRETVLVTNVLDQVGGRLDFNASPDSQFFARYSYSGGHNINPVSVRGTDAPGFPTRDDLGTHLATVSNTQILSPSMTNSLRATYLRHEFFFDKRLNQTPPSALGFGYTSSNAVGQGPPYFNVAGYSPIGGAITGPRNTTQGTFEVQDSVTWANSSHLVKVGGEFRRTNLDMIQAIAPNAFFVFAGTFPTNNAVANLLLGVPVVFYQGLGNFERGVRVWGAGTYAQDEWRVTGRLTLNYGLRYERINPLTEVEDRLNGFVPGVKSQVRADAPVGLLFPGDPGVGRGIAQSANAFMPRAGMAWDPTGTGVWSVRGSYGLFYDQFQNGSGTASQIAISSTPAAQFVQLGGAINFQNPFQGRPVTQPGTFVRPGTQFVLDVDAKPPRVQTWNIGVQRSLFDKYLMEVRYVGAKADNLPRNVEANPAIHGPGATAQNADRRRLYANCPADGGTCDFSTIAMLRSVARSRYDAGQFSVSRRFGDAVGFNVSYWVSKTMDHLSAMNLGGAAAKPLAGENDLAQNPLDLEAEWGPSLFDARHRLVASASWLPRLSSAASGAVRALFDEWQLNGIATYNSGTPFTVSDSANVALQANSPPISGFPASRPNVVGDPNGGPRTVDEWISRSAFQRLSLQTQAGQFGNAGRNIARGPSYASIDVSFVRSFALHGQTRLQFRAEVFNVFNHVNFGLPVADLNSPSFGRIISAGAPRLGQFALKLSF